MARNRKSNGTNVQQREDRQMASSKRDEAFLAERRRREAANLKRTMELRALRLAHEAANPKAAPPKRIAKR